LQHDPLGFCHRYPQNQPSQWRLSPGGGPDTPLACLHRIYGFFVLDLVFRFRNEIEYFCHQYTWSVAAIPDPRDPDKLRYAILAVLTRLLCQAFNKNIALGLPRNTPPVDFDWDIVLAQPRILETMPDWATKVPRVRPEGREYVLEGRDGYPNRGDPGISPEFLSMGILVMQPHYFFV
jgi:hypothetical protein